MSTLKIISSLVTNWDQLDDCKRTPLFYAVKYSDLTTVKYLISKSQNYSIIESVVNYRCHNLFSAALAFNCRFDITRFLVKNINSLFFSQKFMWICQDSLINSVLDLTEINLPWKQVKKRLKIIYQFYPDKKDFGNLICLNGSSMSFNSKPLLNWLFTLPDVIENLESDTISYIYRFIPNNKSGLKLIKAIKNK